MIISKPNMDPETHAKTSMNTNATKERHQLILITHCITILEIKTACDIIPLNRIEHTRMEKSTTLS